MKTIFFAIFTGFNLIALGQLYPVTDIPDSTIQNNHSVIREDILEFDVINPGLAKKHIRLVRTIFDEQAKNHQRVVVGYDDLNKILSLEVVVYDKYGKKIKTFKERDFQDVAAFDRGSILTDNRLKTLSITTLNYPITIALDYTTESQNLMFYPSFFFDSSKEPVMYSKFFASVPSDLGLKYKLVNISEPEISETDGILKYQWVKNNTNKIDWEPFGPPLNELSSVVYLAPNKFVLDGVEGSMNSWEEYGDFQFRLNQGLEGLSQETIDKIQSLTSVALSTEEKIKIVYEYLQKNVRYVSIQLGVGGWRPFSPSYVEHNGYGDCKALTYYTKTLLEAINIPSNYTLVYAGDNPIKLDPGFPRAAFNHVILNVPNNGDTLWLECTSQTNPFGYNGSFTGGRQVLVVSEQGSKVVHTPTYTLEHNTQLRIGKVRIDNEGNAKLAFETRYSGLQYENDDLNFILHYGYDKQKEWLNDNINLPDFLIENFSISGAGDRIPVATVQVELSSSSILQGAGSRIFLAPNLLNQWTYIPKKIENRKSEVIIDMAFQDIDSIWFELPPNLYPDYVNEPISFENEFGSYEANFQNFKGKLLYTRKINHYSGTFPADSYENLRKFYSDIQKADKTKIALRKGT